MNCCKNLILSLACSVFAFCAEASSLKIMLDPGHGGVDSGAVRGSVKEADIALKVSRILKDKLSRDERFKVEMTRTSDHNVSLQERVRIAERSNSDIFLSIHLNSNPDPRARGIELYFQNHLPADEETLFLAANENRSETSLEGINADEPTKKNDIFSIIEDLERSHRLLSSHRLGKELMQAWNGTHQGINIRQAPFYVVSKASIPSVLVELGFISNPKEAEKLSSESYQSEVAEKIYQGLLLYKAHQEHDEEVPVSEKD